MRELPQSFKKNGLNYNQCKRTDTVALYSARNNYDEITSYEVFKIKIGKPHPRDNDQSLKERLPSNESFGKTAWSYTSYYTAIDKFYDLIKEVSNG